MDGQGQRHRYKGTVIGCKGDGDCWWMAEKASEVELLNVLKLTVGSSRNWMVSTVVQDRIQISDGS